VREEREEREGREKRKGVPENGREITVWQPKAKD